jgi:hypothetical protein
VTHTTNSLNPKSSSLAAPTFSASFLFLCILLAYPILD